MATLCINKAAPHRKGRPVSAEDTDGSSGTPAADHGAAPLRIGIVADSPTFPGDWETIRENVRLADGLGYDSVWLGEAWGYELFTSLADLVRVTSRMKLGAGVANIFSRSPAVIAATAATLDQRSGGRMVLGLGSSGPQVVEHWHGVPFTKPLQRTREYIQIINAILRREPLNHHGDIFSLDRGFTIRFTPLRDHIPIYLASLGPKNIQLAGEVADGILPVYWPARDYPDLRAQLDAGSAIAGRPAGSVSIAPYLTVEIVLNEAERAAARQRAAAPVAFYVGRMGTFYGEMLSRHGFGNEVAAIIKGWENGHKSAIAAVSDDLLDATAIIGTPDEVVARLRDWQSRGMDEPLISMPAGTSAQTAARLEALAHAAGLHAASSASA
jgi:F420-dependent oxidoreductase-like protein